MRKWLGLLLVLALVGSLFGIRSAWAEDDDPPADDDDRPAPPAPPEDDQPDPPDDDKPAAGDSDGDGTPDATDTDDNNDGKPDAPAPAAGDDNNDGKPDAPAPGDADGDGTPDATDTDDNNDGKPDVNPLDADGDGKSDAEEDSDGDGQSDLEEAVEKAAETDTDGDGLSDAEEAAYEDVDLNAPDSDGDGTPDALDDGDIDNDGVLDAEEEDPPTDPFDADGDGKVDAEEMADRKEFAEYFDDIPNMPDEAALDGRSEDAELAPSISIDEFRKGVRIVKKIVLEKMGKKIARKADDRMAKFSMIVMGFSLVGILLLFMPLVLRKKYPGQGKLLFKYSALAALVFVVTVNLFGGVLYGLRTVQGALSSYTNPSVAIASGTFDTLDDNAEKYVAIGKELFLPTMEQLRNNPEEQPAIQILQNGQRIIKDAQVFLSIAKMFKRVDFVFNILPIVLTFVTLVLFVIAIKPTLVEIVKLPAMAATGQANSREGAARQVMANSMRRVKGEMLATVCTIGVLVVLTLLSSLVLGRIVGPALDALLTYFSITVQYLQFADGASSGLVFVALFGVIMFLVLNLAALILSMSFFLGKSQKIFQARFNEGVPLSNHTRFFKWGAPSVLLVQLFPLLFTFVAGFVIDGVTDAVLGITDAEKVAWAKMLLLGPAVLVVAFAALFWAVRGIAAIKFLATYKVKPKAPKPSAGTL